MTTRTLTFLALILVICLSPLKAQAPTFTLVIGLGFTTNGKSTGTYEAGVAVPISARAPRRGLKFVEWIPPDGVANPKAANTTIIVPDHNHAVVATFVP